MQLRASRSGASSGSGNEGWFLRTFSRDVTAKRRVSRFCIDASLVRRMSAPENRLKTSSTDSGSCQNYTVSTKPLADLPRDMTYACPVWVVGGDVLVFREPKDALLEDELGLGGAHGWVSASHTQ